MLDILNGRELYNKIDELREKRGWTIYKLATKAGVSSTTIYNWRDNGSVPSLTLLEAVCNALDVSIYNFLLDEKDLTAITDEQKEILFLYNALPQNKKKILKDLLKAF